MEPVEILLVEDNEGDIILTRKAFDRGRLQVNLNAVTNGEDAILYLQKEGDYAKVSTPDIILLDLNLPRVSGQEVLRFVKNHEAIKRIPVIVLTTSEADEDVVRMYDLHANGYIVKPVDVQKFFGIIRQIEDFWLQIVRLPQNR